MRKETGFTLMEIMVVIAIIGVLSAIAVPTYLGALPKLRVKDAAMDLGANIQQARLQAIKINGDCTVTFAAGSYTISCLSKTVSLGDYGAGVVFGSVSSTSITFTSRGLTTAMSATTVELTNTDGSARYEIRVLPTGALHSDKL